MKTNLNNELSEIAKANLTLDDIRELSETLNIAESTVYNVISGKKKGSEIVIDTIIDRTKKRLDLNKLKLGSDE